MLIVDGDLGFTFWLGHVLDAAAYLALPAKSPADAALLVMQLDLKVDVLVINLALAGAVDFIAALHRSQSNIKVIGVLNEAQQDLNVPGVHVTQSKPAIPDRAAQAEWLQCIERVLQASV